MLDDLTRTIESSGQAASGSSKPVGGGAWQSGLGQAMSELPQTTTAQPSTSPASQYGALNPDPNAGMNWGMAGEGRYYPSSMKDLGKHLGDVLPGGIGAPNADPMYQMFGDQVSPVFKKINNVWQTPGNIGQKLGGKLGRFLAVGNPFDLF